MVLAKNHSMIFKEKLFIGVNHRVGNALKLLIAINNGVDEW